MIILPILGLLPISLLSLTIVLFCLNNTIGINAAYILMAPCLCAAVATESILSSIQLKVPSAKALSTILAGLVALDAFISTRSYSGPSASHSSLMMLQLLSHSTAIASTMCVVALLPVISAEFVARWCMGELTEDLDPLLKAARIVAVIFIISLGLQFFIDALSPLISAS